MSKNDRPRQPRRESNRDRQALPSDSPLARWLIASCAEHELSWAEASRRSGLFAGAISSFVRGVCPGLAACKALADYFEVPTDYVLVLAGHTPPPVDITDPEIQVLCREYEKLPAKKQPLVMASWRSALRLAQAADEPSEATPPPAETGKTGRRK